jgi:hypothetical protein
MAAVYGNAVCNLACVSPPADFRSQLQLDPRAYIPCILGSPGPCTLFGTKSPKIRNLPTGHGRSNSIGMIPPSGRCSPEHGTLP